MLTEIINEPEYLLARTHTGQTGYGMGAVGPGKSTVGSQRILDALERERSQL